MVSQKKKIAGIILALITIQMIGVGIIDLGVADFLNDENEMQMQSNENESQQTYSSHATSFRWEVDRNSPLYTEWLENDNSEELLPESDSLKNTPSPHSQ
ncbi:MAG: hypothetical protein ACTSUK_05505, partial [Promethearchaeota archaeon]